ncbi:MAG: phosphatase PAP2 family protein [Planctomycetes bacterium]|nr:phosphatase PAP2 family protein [Planctomycetota bacterium]
MEGLRKLDHGTYAFFSHEFKPDSALLELFKSLTFLGTYWVVAAVALAAVAIALLAGRFRSSLVIAVCFVIAVGLAEGLNLATERRRPNDAQRFVAAQNMASSFPARAVLLSTYSWLALAMALESAGFRKRLTLGFSALALLAILVVCMTQLILSLHFLTDILAGLAGGAALALLAKHFGTRPAALPVTTA